MRDQDNGRILEKLNGRAKQQRLLYAQEEMPEEGDLETTLL